MSHLNGVSPSLVGLVRFCLSFCYFFVCLLSGDAATGAEAGPAPPTVHAVRRMERRTGPAVRLARDQDGRPVRTGTHRRRRHGIGALLRALLLQREPHRGQQQRHLHVARPHARLQK